MTKTQYAAAIKIAQNEDLSQIDDTPLHGCALPEFQPVFVAIEQVAKMIAHLGHQFNGGWDFEAVNDFYFVAKKKFTII